MKEYETQMPTIHSSVRFHPEQDIVFDTEIYQLGEFTNFKYGVKAYGLYRPKNKDYFLFDKSHTDFVFKAFNRFLLIDTFEECFELFDNGIEFLNYPEIIKKQAHRCDTDDSQYNLLGSLLGEVNHLTIGMSARIEINGIEYLVAPLDDLRQIYDLHQFLFSEALKIEQKLNTGIN